jgi:hypothetical protein
MKDEFRYNIGFHRLLSAFIGFFGGLARQTSASRTPSRAMRFASAAAAPTAICRAQEWPRAAATARQRPDSHVQTAPRGNLRAKIVPSRK